VKLKGKKSQAAITDLFIAIAIFIVLIIVTTTLWNLYNVRLINRMAYDDIVIKSFQVSDMLLKTPGNPVNWENEYWDNLGFDQTEIDGIRYPGLIERDIFVPYRKIRALEDFNETSMQEKFHAGQYRFSIKVVNLTGDTINSFGNPGGSSTFSINLARSVMYQESEASGYEPAVIEVMLSR